MQNPIEPADEEVVFAPEDEPIELGGIADKPPVPHMVKHVMEVLAQSAEASYLVWLKLSLKYGSMQKVV
jgi:hypothetical protein